MSEGPERVILLPRGLDQHDDEGPGGVGKPDRAAALADAPAHDGQPRIFSVQRDACIEIARSQCGVLVLPKILTSAQRGATVKPYPIPRYVSMRYCDPSSARRSWRMCSRRPEAPVASTRKPVLTGDPRAA